MGTLLVDGSTISGNSSTGDGGGINNAGPSGILTILSSTISGNTAEDGAGIANFNDLTGARITTIINSTISGNVASGPGGEADADGGGIYNDQGLIIIRDCTITNNSAPTGFGSGILSKANNLTRTEVYSSIIAGNANTDVDFVEGAVNSFMSDGYNLIGTGNALANFNQPGDQTGVLNPMLEALADNGGPTMTHALMAGSPAIDAGDPAATAGFATVPLHDRAAHRIRACSTVTARAARGSISAQLNRSHRSFFQRVSSSTRWSMKTMATSARRPFAPRGGEIGKFITCPGTNHLRTIAHQRRTRHHFAHSRPYRHL